MDIDKPERGQMGTMVPNASFPSLDQLDNQSRACNNAMSDNFASLDGCLSKDLTLASRWDSDPMLCIWLDKVMREASKP